MCTCVCMYVQPLVKWPSCETINLLTWYHNNKNKAMKLELFVEYTNYVYVCVCVCVRSKVSRFVILQIERITKILQSTKIFENG